MGTYVEIDLNLRVEHNRTISDLDVDVYGGRPVVGQKVTVFERESGIRGEATVHSIHEESRIIYLTVDWENLHFPEPSEAVIPF